MKCVRYAELRHGKANRVVPIVILPLLLLGDAVRGQPQCKYRLQRYDRPLALIQNLLRDITCRTGCMIALQCPCVMAFALVPHRK